jgi:hypothetical protein
VSARGAPTFLRSDNGPEFGGVAASFRARIRGASVLAGGGAPNGRLAGPLPIGATLAGAGGFDGYRIVDADEHNPGDLDPCQHNMVMRRALLDYSGFFWGRLTSNPTASLGLRVSMRP